MVDVEQGEPLEPLPVDMDRSPEPDAAAQLSRLPSSKAPMVLGVLALVVAAGVGYSHLQLRREVDRIPRPGQTDVVVVPELRNLRVDEAMRVLRSLGIRGGVGTSQGEVFAQEPGAGTRIPAGGIVGLRTRASDNGRCERTLHAWESATGDGLPPKGRATLDSAEAVLRNHADELKDEYRATTAHIERVSGRVWTRTPEGEVVTEAADVYVIVLTLGSARDCPGEPVFGAQGVPLSFVVAGGD